MTGVEVRPLVETETTAAAAVLGRGMRDNPIHERAFGADAGRREAALTRLFGAVLGGHVERGTILGAFSSGTLVGVCSMVPPGGCQLSGMDKLRMIPTLVGAAGLGPALRALRWALIVNGITSLAEQARVLGHPRSTAWSVLQGNHKGAGLKADVVARMLRSQKLPEDARWVVIRYVQQRVDGAYGHSELLRRRFVMRLEKLGCASIIQQLDPAKRRR